MNSVTVMELAAPFEMTQPAISRHLKVLEGAGLIVRRVEGTKRPCRLAPDGIPQSINGLRYCVMPCRRTTTGLTRFWPS